MIDTTQHDEQPAEPREVLILVPPHLLVDEDERAKVIALLESVYEDADRPIKFVIRGMV